VTGSVVRLTLLALLLAVALGAVVSGMSQMAAVDVADPRPDVPPPSIPATPTPTVSPSLSPSPTPSPVATPTPTAEGGDVWVYTTAAGDSISRIAIRFGSSTDELLDLNPEYADNQDLVQAGAQMILPCTPIAEAEARC